MYIYKSYHMMRLFFSPKSVYVILNLSKNFSIEFLKKFLVTDKIYSLSGLNIGRVGLFLYMNTKEIKNR